MEKHTPAQQRMAKIEARLAANRGSPDELFLHDRCRKLEKIVSAVRRMPVTAEAHANPFCGCWVCELVKALAAMASAPAKPHACDWPGCSLCEASKP